MKKVPSYDCANSLSARVSEVVSSGKTVGILDFDELSVKWQITNARSGAGRTVPTELGKRLDGLFADPRLLENLHGLLIVTARLARPLDSKNIQRRFSDEAVGEHRRVVMETTNAELETCLPNITKFLRSEANFGGGLPDRSRYEEEEQYRRNGYTVHKNGFIWNCGVIVMGGAMDGGGKIRHCKHATLIEVLLKIPSLPSEYTVFYLDDTPKWFGPFLEKGFCEGVSMHLLHYNFEKSEARKRKVLPKYVEPDMSVQVAENRGSYFYSAVKYCCVLVAVVCIAKRYCSTRGLNPFNYVRDALKLMRYIAYKVLLDRQY